MSPRFLFSFAPRLLALLLVATLAAPAFGAADAGTLDAARADLVHLKGLLRKRKPAQGDLIAYVKVVGAAHLAAEGDAKRVEKLRRDIEADLVKALGATRVKEGVNLLEDVNVAAAEALGVIGPTVDVKTRKSLAKALRNAITGLHEAKRHEPTPIAIDATFDALARTGDLGTLRWLLENYSHTRSNQSVYLVSAHRAMVLFDDAPGKLRFEIVKTFQKLYAGLESNAQQSSTSSTVAAAKRTWDRIRVSTIAVLQKFAGFPENAQGAALSTVGEFQSWFREHKNARKAPWIDDAPKKTKK